MHSEKSGLVRMLISWIVSRKLDGCASPVLLAFATPYDVTELCKGVVPGMATRARGGARAPRARGGYLSRAPRAECHHRPRRGYARRLLRMLTGGLVAGACECVRLCTCASYQPIHLI